MYTFSTLIFSPQRGEIFEFFNPGIVTSLVCMRSCDKKITKSKWRSHIDIQSSDEEDIPQTLARGSVSMSNPPPPQMTGQCPPTEQGPYHRASLGAQKRPNCRAHPRFPSRKINFSCFAKNNDWPNNQVPWKTRKKPVPKNRAPARLLGRRGFVCFLERENGGKGSLCEGRIF